MKNLSVAQKLVIAFGALLVLFTAFGIYAEHNVAEQDVTLGVRPDHLMLCADGIKGTVDVSEMMGSSVHLHVAAEGKDVIVIVPTNGAAAHFPMGSEVNMIFGGNVAHVFDKTTGKNLEW